MVREVKETILLQERLCLFFSFNQQLILIESASIVILRECCYDNHIS